MKTFSIVSLGCFRNLYDSEVIAYEFEKKGFSLKEKAKSLDTLIINTCGFIDKAKEESIEFIKNALELKKRGQVKKVIVAGCLVQRYKAQLQRYFKAIDEFRGVVAFGEGLRRRKLMFPFVDFLKICEGCSHQCSFCAIPQIKGRLKSRPLEDIVAEAVRMEKQGVQELNIIGQDTTSWGRDLKGKLRLAELVKEILKATKIRWIRLLYLDPQSFDDSLIELISGQRRICKYIDFPIQHINDRILKLMNRNTSRKYLINKIKFIRKKIKNVVIRSSVIVGFPTETEKEFGELLSFIKEVKFERLGAFIYSREEGTPAYNFKPQVHYKTKQKRFTQLMEAQREIAYAFNRKMIGKKTEVLVERKEGNYFTGRTSYDAYDIDNEVLIRKRKLKKGSFYRLKIVDSYGYDLIGQ